MAAVNRIPLSLLPRVPATRLAPSWRQARPARISAALQAAGRRDPGGWFVAGAREDLPAGLSVTRLIAGREVVLWRTGTGDVVAGPGACPHLGALLDRCPVAGDALLCRWHGLRLPPTGAPGWRPFPAVDDGVLLWVRLPVPDETPTEAPAAMPRPPLSGAVPAVVCLRTVCEPRDILANRLDPWHGAWLHPYAFSHLTVDEQASTQDRLVLDVAFRVGGRWAVPVTVEFTCPDARTVVMQILEGEGAGSVVETHATPLGPDHLGRPVTVMTEATIATSDRPGFRVAARLARPVLQAGIRETARRLWVDDLEYASRLWQLRGAP